MYHEVAGIPERDKQIRRIDPAYSLPVQQFEEQMKCITGNGYVVMAVDHLADSVSTEDRSVCITFDDGLAGNYTHAFPVLQKYSLKATFFVVVDKISKSRFMNWSQLIELHRYGHSIQSHTLSHPMLGESDDEKIFQELDRSKKIIEDRIGSRVDSLSLPFGSSSRRVIEIARDVGYSIIFTSRINELQVDEIPYRFGRIPVKDGYGLDTFEELLEGRTALYYKLVFLDLIKSSLKGILGLNNYRRVYRALKKIQPER